MTAPIAGVAGSLRADSYTRALLSAAAGLLPPGVRINIWAMDRRICLALRVYQPSADRQRRDVQLGRTGQCRTT